ncbi:MAG: CpaF family protein [Lachnospiraceae bacterium]|nr:CpaF family protein [Lachnospiraceae bacterium]
MSREHEEEELLAIIDEEICREAKKRVIPLNWRRELRMQVFHSLRKLDVLQELLNQDDITEIMVNGAEHIFYEKGGEILAWDKSFSSSEKLEDIIQQMVSSHNRVINEAEPIADTRLPDGSRVNVVLPPVAINGPAVSIRKFPKDPILMEQMIEGQSISRECAEFLEKLVRAGYNIFISGGTGSGKTTFLNALSEFIPKQERVITIEDSAELQIQGIANLVRMETRNAGVEGTLAITIRDLIRTALRMRPDRLIIGEVRGAECLDMLQAMNTGHDGSLSTGHANNCEDMISRMETMVLMGMELPLLAIRAQIAAGVDIMVHLGRLRDRTRRLLSIVEVDKLQEGVICLNPLYEFVEMGEQNGKITGSWLRKGQLIHKGKLYAAGIEMEDSRV